MDTERSQIIRPGLWVDKKKLLNVKKKLREKVPPIKIISNYKSIIVLLRRKGYEYSAVYMENLVKLENSLINKKMVNQSILKNGFNIIIKLIETLKAMENNPNETSHIYELLKFICDLNQTPEKDYQWFIEQMFLLIITYGQNFSENGNEDFIELETKGKYYYSEFLIKNDLHEDALELLLETNNKCEGKFWVITTNDEVVKLLYNEINNLISICYMTLSKNFKRVNLLLEKECAENALKYAKISLNEETVAKAYFCNSKVLLRKNREIEALVFLDTSIVYAERISNKQILCKCYKSKGQIYYGRGNVKLAEECIQQVISIAQDEHNLQIYNGKSLALLAEWNLSNKNYDKAVYYYSLALQKFIVTGLEMLILHTRFLFGMMFYKKLESIYFELIESISYSKYNQYHQYDYHRYYDQMHEDYGKDEDEQDARLYENLVEKILLWRDKHVPFWDNLHRHQYVLSNVNLKVSKSIVELADENDEESGLVNEYEINDNYYRYAYQSVEKLVEIIRSNELE